MREFGDHTMRALSAPRDGSEQLSPVTYVEGGAAVVKDSPVSDTFATFSGLTDCT